MTDKHQEDENGNARLGKLRMSGQDVFKHAVTKLAKSTSDLLELHNIEKNSINWIIPHQANQRILDKVVEKLKLPKEKLVSTVAYHGNTSAASIPLALDSIVQSGKANSGDLISMQAIGGGLSWGSCIIKL